MKVSRLHIRNFRSYEDADLILSPGMNVFLGQNAQGKTNLLESLVYLSLSKSHRVNDDRLLIRRGQEYADLECTVQDGCDKTLRAVIHSRGKTLFLNRQVLKRSSDFIGQLNQIKKMGSMKDLMGMIPGMDKALKGVEISDDAFKPIEAMINSMTPAERSNPALLNGSRKNRIAKGAGVTIVDLNRFIKQFEQTSKMMRKVQQMNFKRR